MKSNYRRLFFLLAFYISAQIARAATLDYQADLSGPAEFPANASPATGHANVFYDAVAHSLRVQVTFSGLMGTTTASHIHAATAAPFTGTAGVATQVPTFSSLPLGVTAGTFDQTLDLTSASSWNPAFVTAHGGTPATAEAALANALNLGESYLNIHTTAFPSGEIRGFLVAVPDVAGTLSLLLIGLAASACARKLALQVRQV